MHTFSCCLRLRGIGELRKNVVVKISQTDFNDGCTILWISKYVCCLASAFIVCLLLNVGFVGVGLKTLSHSLLIPESIEHIEYLLDPQKDVRYTLVQAQSFRVWLFVTPWARAHQALRSMRFSRQEYWSGLPFPPPGDLSEPRIEPRLLHWQADSLPLHHPRSPNSRDHLTINTGKHRTEAERLTSAQAYVSVAEGQYLEFSWTTQIF